MTRRVQLRWKAPSARRGTQPVEPFGRIGRRTSTQYSPFSLIWPVRARTRLSVDSGVSDFRRVITLALALGRVRAATVRSTWAQRESPFGPLKEKAPFAPFGVEGRT